MTSKFCILAGAPKCATTTLAGWLDSRSDMRLGELGKEPNFFSGLRPDLHPARDMDRYLASFAGVPEGEWAVDASTDYLWSEGAAERLADFARGRQVRVIVVLRDPVDRAYSEWRHTVRDGWQTLSFRHSLALEAQRRATGEHQLFYHAARSRYHAPLLRFMELFGDDLLLVDYAEFGDREVLWSRIQAFLGVERQALAGEAHSNESNDWRSRSLMQAMHDRERLAWLRRALPAPAKRRLYDLMRRAMRSRREITRAEEWAVFARIADDARACLADPRIPTDSWARSRRLVAAAASLPVRIEPELSRAARVDSAGAAAQLEPRRA